SLIEKFYKGKEREAHLAKGHISPTPEAETQRIQGLFARTQVETHAKKGTCEYVRLQVDAHAKKLLQQEQISSNQEVALDILTDDFTPEFEQLEMALHAAIVPDLLTLKPHESELIKSLSFRNILRAKLVDLLRNEKRFPVEEIA